MLIRIELFWGIVRKSAKTVHKSEEKNDWILIVTKLIFLIAIFNRTKETEMKLDQPPDIKLDLTNIKLDLPEIKLDLPDIKMDLPDIFSIPR